MRTLYSAANLVEAHMLQDLLKQQGITATVQGEYLQAGVGDLPTAGLIRLMIEDEHYGAARIFIEEWERSNPSDTVTSKSVQSRGGNSVFRVAVAFLAGLLVSYLFFKLPISVYAVDQNGDGKNDEFWSYSSAGDAVSIESDRNFDGEIDVVTKFDSDGDPFDSQEDNDFDGTYETSYVYQFGRVQSAEADTDGDGKANRIYRFENGVLKTEEYISGESGAVTRIDTFQRGSMISSMLDRNEDGVMDVVREYDSAGEIISDEALE